MGGAVEGGEGVSMEEARAKQEAQIRHYREIANRAGYCGAIVWSWAGEIDGQCAREVGHDGEHRP
jgi:hypothetical protein